MTEGNASGENVRRPSSAAFDAPPFAPGTPVIVLAERQRVLRGKILDDRPTHDGEPGYLIDVGEASRLRIHVLANWDSVLPLDGADPADGDPEPERPAPARVPPVSLEARVAVLDSTLSLVDAAGILGVGVDDVARAAARSGKRFERSELPIRVSMSDVTDYLACEGFEVMPKSAGGYIVDRRHSFDECHLVGFANRRRAAAGLPKFSVAAGSGPVQRGSLRHGEPFAHL